MIQVVAKSFPKPDQVEHVIGLYTELVELTRAETGCISYELHQDVKNPEILAMIEVWASMEALQAHLESEHFKRIVPEIKQFMVRETELNIYKKRL